MNRCLSKIQSAAVPVLIALLSLAVLYPLSARHCAWETHDLIFNMERYAAASQCIRDGHWTALWSRDINFGYGYPLLLFYPPLTVFFIAGLHLAGIGILSATKLLAVLSAAGAAILAYRLGRHLWKERAAAALVAACYALLPYHLLTLMTRGAMAEFAAHALLPGLLLAYLKLRRPTPVQIVRAAGFSALLMLTHNASWLLIIPIAAILPMVGWLPVPSTRGAHGPNPDRSLKNAGKTLLGVIGSTILGLGLSAAYWVPAFVEKSRVRISNLQQAEHLSYIHHFADWEKIIRNDWAYAGLGTVMTVVWILAVIGIFRCRIGPERRIIAALLILVPLITFLSMSPARPVWDMLEILQYVQFPWRLTVLSGLSAAAAAPAMLCLFRSRRWRNAVTGSVIAVLFITAFQHTLRPIFRFNDRVGLSRHHLRTSGTTTVVGDEYRPLTVKTHPEELYGPRETTWHLDTPGAVCVPDRDRSAEISAFIISDVPVTVHVHCLYFPGWRASLNRRPIPVAIDRETGLMILNLPPGDHYAALRFGTIPIRTAGRVIAVIAILFSLVVLIRNRHHASRHVTDRKHPGLLEV